VGSCHDDAYVQLLFHDILRMRATHVFLLLLSHNVCFFLPVEQLPTILYPTLSWNQVRQRELCLLLVRLSCACACALFLLSLNIFILQVI
jgi:hypothetical protein